MEIAPFAHFLLALVAAPLLIGAIHRTKALFAGRRGQPLLQPYHDIWKLLRKGAVYSRTTTWVFRAGPLVSLAAAMAAAALLPFAGAPALVAFPGDFILLACLLGSIRFATVLAALDTGSSFEGMGASREVEFSALAEPVLFLGLAALAAAAESLSLSDMLFVSTGKASAHHGLVLALVAAATAVVLLAENARIPVDDPNTHLELTMVHEVMVLDHGGPDLAFIQYASALKLWVLGQLLAGLVLPLSGLAPWAATAAAAAGMLAVAVAVGIVESSMARLRLVRVPQLLVGAGVLSTLALLLILS
jgi:formate hydrogenlyase subunit 4